MNTTTRSRTGRADSGGEGERPREPKLLAKSLGIRTRARRSVVVVGGLTTDRPQAAPRMAAGTSQIRSTKGKEMVKFCFTSASPGTPPASPPSVRGCAAGATPGVYTHQLPSLKGLYHRLLCRHPSLPFADYNPHPSSSVPIRSDPWPPIANPSLSSLLSSLPSVPKATFLGKKR